VASTPATPRYAVLCQPGSKTCERALDLRFLPTADPECPICLRKALAHHGVDLDCVAGCHLRCHCRSRVRRCAPLHRRRVSLRCHAFDPMHHGVDREVRSEVAIRRGRITTWRPPSSTVFRLGTVAWSSQDVDRGRVDRSLAASGPPERARGVPLSRARTRRAGRLVSVVRRRVPTIEAVVDVTDPPAE